MPESKDKDDFLAQSSESRTGLGAEFVDFLRDNKKWWLAPIIIFLALFGALLVLTEGSAIAPFIYTLF